MAHSCVLKMAWMAMITTTMVMFSGTNNVALGMGDNMMRRMLHKQRWDGGHEITYRGHGHGNGHGRGPSCSQDNHCDQAAASSMMIKCCRGSCVDTSYDLMNCGGCDTICSSNYTYATAAAYSSIILCSAGKCIDTSNDPLNCGRLHHRCHHYCYNSVCDYGL